MKKFIKRTLLVLILLVILAAVALHFFLDVAIKRGAEAFGPKLAQVDVKLDGVNLFILSGSCSLDGLVVGNPQGYKTPWAINVDHASVALKPASLLSDKIVVSSISVKAPQITFETDLRHNNLSKIISNLEEATGGSDKPAAKTTEAKPAETKPGKKIEVDDLLISGGKVRVSVTSMGGKSATVPLPEIHLTNLGRDSDGITAAELSKRVLVAIEEGAAQASVGAIADLGKGAVYMTKDLEKAGTNSVEKVTKSISDLFKKE